MRILKMLALGIGGLLGLAVLLMIAVVLFVDPNDYKDRIASAVQSATGRKLSIPGELELTVFPRLAIEVGQLSLGNPAGFGDAPFATIEGAKLHVNLLPLLRRQLEVGRIDIDGLALQLQQDAEGKGNWEEWGTQAADAREPAEDATPAELDLAGVRVTNGRIVFEELLIQDLDVDIGRVRTGQPVDVAMDLVLVSAPGAAPQPLAADFELTVDLDGQRYGLADLALEGELPVEGAAAPVAWAFHSPAVALDMKAQTLDDTPFEAQIGVARLTGSVEGRQLVNAPALAGRFSLQSVAPRELMQQFAIDPPVTRDPSRLASLGAQGNFSWTGGEARATDLAVALDDSRLAGEFAYDTDSGAMRFALDLDRIDLDAYQPPPTDEAADSGEPIELPVDFLEDLDAQGTFDVQDITLAGVRLQRFSATITVQEAVARFSPLKAQLYGGEYAGDIGLDMRNAIPRLSLNATMSDIDMAQFMKDFADSSRLSGRGTLSAQLTADGGNGDALVKTLRGQLAANLAGGAVEGIDLWYAIAQAQSLIEKRAMAEATNTRRTAFDTFRASASVVDGVATTRDLDIASQLLRVTGGGSTSLVTQAIDYRITATVLKTPPGADSSTAPLVRAAIPVKITGTLADPTVRPDLAGMARERLKQEVEEKKDEIKEKVKEKVQDQLKRLLGG